MVLVKQTKDLRACHKSTMMPVAKKGIVNSGSGLGSVCKWRSSVTCHGAYAQMGVRQAKEDVSNYAEVGQRQKRVSKVLLSNISDQAVSLGIAEKTFADGAAALAFVSQNDSTAYNFSMAFRLPACQQPEDAFPTHCFRSNSTAPPQRQYKKSVEDVEDTEILELEETNECRPTNSSGYPVCLQKDSILGTSTSPKTKFQRCVSEAGYKFVFCFKYLFI